jgi:hypothetical protein
MKKNPLEIPPPSGPPRVRVQPAARERIHPVLGVLRWWENRCWKGFLPVTKAPIQLYPEYETPEEFPAIWTTWLSRVDRDPEWIVRQIQPELKKLAGYGWPVFPFQPTLGLVAFDPTDFDIYLDTPALEPHVIEVHFNERMKVRSASLAG